MLIDKKLLVDYFLKYVAYNTTSDPDSTTIPTTASQKEFAKLLAQDLIELKLADVEIHEPGYVTATLPANIDRDIPILGFLAHNDTSCDCSGKDVRPQIIENYNGGDIKLGTTKVMSPTEFPNLLGCIGHDLITTDGTTLLGADDKAGVAIILAAINYLMEHPEIEHGKIRLAFTHDEETGTGMKDFDVKDFGADFGYTVDSEGHGAFTYETFNAAKAKVEITGKSVHPGSAKGVMVNAGLIAAEFIASFPESEQPSTTEAYEGFYHLNRGSFSCEYGVLHYFIRDHDKDKFEMRKTYFAEKVRQFNEKYNNALKLNMQDQYYNMKEVLKDKPEIINLALDAMKAVGVEPLIKPTRGGTDGCMLSFKGLPCPNIFTGGYNAHGPYEYASIQSMLKSAEVLVKIVELNAK